LLYVNYGAIQFSSYRFISQSLKPLKLPNGAEAFVSGAVAGASATTVTYPFDLLRTRFAAQGPERVYTSFRGAIRDIWRDEGLKGYFRGVGAGVGQVVPYMGLFFAGYETLRPLLAPIHLPFGSGDAMAGVTASVLAKTGVFPLDLIRKRLQVQGPTRARYVGGTIPVYGTGVWNTGNSIVRREGWRGLYRGMGVGLVKSAPASAITMWTYERAIRVMKELKEPGVEI
jgi:solute carrier family 25 thiamine pyrophosphate transporter 19